MTIKQWMEINCWAINPTASDGKFWNVDIGFINSKTREEDDAVFTIDAYNLSELEELFNDFCKENNISNHTVAYVAVVETTNSEKELI